MCGEQAGKLACCVLGQDTQRDAYVFMWQTDGGAKQSIRRGGPSLIEDLQTDHGRQCSMAYIYIFLHKAHSK